MAGMSIRAIYPPGFAVKCGSGPDAGSTPIYEENSRISRTANQKDGVAMPAMENTRIS